MKNLIFNSNTLEFQESGIEKKIIKLYGTIIPLVIFIFIIFYTNNIVNSQLNDTINQLNNTIKEKNKQIKRLQTPYSNVDSIFLKELKENMKCNLTREESRELNRLAIKYRSLIDSNNIPHALVWRVCFKESRFNIKAVNKQGSSAKGLFGFINSTWNAMCKRAGMHNGDRFDERKQLLVMIEYLNYLYAKYGNWNSAMREYHGGKFLYPVSFLFK
jgi:hypothetical protein